MSLKQAARGMTLVEVMVAMTISLLLTWGAFQVYLQARHSLRAAESLARLQENARFALEALEPDLRLAGFWGRHRDTARIFPASGIQVQCDGQDISSWALDVRRPLAASDDHYDLPCAPYSTARVGSDVLVLRHASELTRAPQDRQVQVQGSLAAARLFDDGVVPEDLASAAETRDFILHAYYVDNHSSFASGTPSLRRLSLVRGGVIEDEELISGVENLQVQFGLDQDGDGTVERYAEADDPALDEESVAAVRLWLLLRAEEAAVRDFTDAHSYPPPDSDLPAITPGSALYPAGFRRRAFTRTVLLRNRIAG